jgi:hypothetical protein
VSFPPSQSDLRDTYHILEVIQTCLPLLKDDGLERGLDRRPLLLSYEGLPPDRVKACRRALLSVRHSSWRPCL